MALSFDIFKRYQMKIIVPSVVILIFCFSLYESYFSDEFGKEEWRSVSSYIQAEAKPEDLLLFVISS